MNRALENFSVETESAIRLMFGDGTSARVHPNDLAQHLNAHDVRKVEKALQIRKSYIKRVLPPWLMLGLVLAAVGIGGYDVSRIIALNKPMPVTGISQTASATSWDMADVDSSLIAGSVQVEAPAEPSVAAVVAMDPAPVIAPQTPAVSQPAAPAVTVPALATPAVMAPQAPPATTTVRSTSVVRVKEPSKAVSSPKGADIKRK